MAQRDSLEHVRVSKPIGQTEPVEGDQPVAFVDSFEFFPNDNDLTPAARCAYMALTIEASVLWFFLVLMISVEATTRPGLSQAVRIQAVVSGLLVVGHLFMEYRRPQVLSRVRWGVFALLIAELTWTTSAFCNSWTEVAVWGGCMVVAGGMLGAAHWLHASKGRGPRVVVLLLAVFSIGLPIAGALAVIVQFWP